MKNETLTLDKLLDVIDSVPRIEWMAFTVSPSAWTALRNLAPAKSNCGSFGGADVHILAKQKSGVLKWSNKQLMQDYIAALDADVYMAENNMLDACERIEEAMWPDIIGI